MSTATMIRSSSECSAKTPRTVVENAVPLPDIVRYCRADLGMSRRDAQWMAREVYRCEATSATNLPAGWHQAIWPARTTFERRTPGISDPTPRDAIKNIEREAS